ncbi:unnamed protein product [Amoebophrya sp. A25]|nr:unnamed protein product [Amoebophrya sp. A25]|eukprot:GSA25T00000292001.1
MTCSLADTMSCPSSCINLDAGYSKSNSKREKTKSKAEGSEYKPRSDEEDETSSSPQDSPDHKSPSQSPAASDRQRSGVNNDTTVDGGANNSRGATPAGSTSRKKKRSASVDSPSHRRKAARKRPEGGVFSTRERENNMLRDASSGMFSLSPSQGTSSPSSSCNSPSSVEDDRNNLTFAKGDKSRTSTPSRTTRVLRQNQPKDVASRMPRNKKMDNQKGTIHKRACEENVKSGWLKSLLDPFWCSWDNDGPTGRAPSQYGRFAHDESGNAILFASSSFSATSPSL